MSNNKYPKPIKVRKPKIVNAPQIFHCDLQTIISRDRSNTDNPELEIPIVLQLLLKNSEEFVNREGVFRTSAAKKKVKGTFLKSKFRLFISAMKIHYFRTNRSNR